MSGISPTEAWQASKPVEFNKVCTLSMPVSQVQPCPSGQHWLVGMHCPLHLYWPATCGQMRHTRGQINLLQQETLSLHTLHCPHLCHRNRNRLGTGRHPGMRCHMRHSVQHPSAGQSRSHCCPQRSLQTLACSCMTLPGTRWLRCRLWCRCHNAANLTAG